MKMVFNFKSHAGVVPLRSRKMKRRFLLINSLILLAMLLLSACSASAPETTPSSGKLKVVATTTLIGDIVKNIGGEQIDLSVLLPIGADPHNFEPSPKDLALVANADIVFTNGAGLEGFMSRLLENAGSKAAIISLSDGLTLINTAEEGAQSSDTDHGSSDPHVWMDPNNVQHWVDRIEQVLSEADPGQAMIYQANAQAYRQALTDLDAWISQQVTQVPQANRKIVSDHVVFGYFARRYGFEQVGAVIPSISTLASPSAQELASLEETIKNLGVKAIFVDSTVNPALSQRIASDTQTQVVPVYSGSLSPAGGPAATYLDFMRADVSAIVQALK
jgi:manganese/iron transport system substrate-binding protein